MKQITATAWKTNNLQNQIRRLPRTSDLSYEHTICIIVLLITVLKTRLPNTFAKQKLYEKKSIFQQLSRKKDDPYFFFLATTLYNPFAPDRLALLFDNVERRDTSFAQKR